MDNEIPLGKRTQRYRCFEILPAAVSVSAFALLVGLSFIEPVWAAVFVLVVIAYMLVKAVRLGVHAIIGSRHMRAAMRVPWHERLNELATAQRGQTPTGGEAPGAFNRAEHVENVRRVAVAPGAFPRVRDIYNAVIVPAYNESYELIAPTIQSLVDTTFDDDRLIVVFAYEERGGEGIRRTAELLRLEFGHRFAAFELVEHPGGVPGEVPGKGANITHAARRLRSLLDERRISHDRVIVTSLDCDNRPHPSYFDAVTYEYVVHPERSRMSFQPISIFTNNIWDAPAPSRVVASGNSIWNIVTAIRPRSIRNFASHAQPMDALVAMDFWSTRTIVEDGHQFWRSYFHFGGDYTVLSVPVPIYQDVVLAGSFGRTMKAQFNQLRRWAYGASDVPFVAVRLFSRSRRVPLGDGIVKFFQLVEGHVTLSCVAFLIMIGPWVPIVVNGWDPRLPQFVESLPFIVGTVQQVSVVLLVITIRVSMSILPARPDRVAASRTLMMVVQWILLPITALVFNAASAFISQLQLAVGQYREVFVVTEKFAIAPGGAAPRMPHHLPR